MTAVVLQSPTIVESPEYLITLAAVHRTTSDSQREHVQQALDQGLDWARLITFASRHKLWGMVYRWLKRNFPHRLPAEIRAEGEDYLLRVSGRAMMITAQMLKIVRGLEEAGASPIPFKGPMLAEQLYGPDSLREYIDLDILVRPVDVPRAKAALEAQGFVYNYRDIDQDSVDAPGEGVGYNFVFYRSDLDFRLELHWNIVRRTFYLPLKVEDFWTRCHNVIIAGKPVRTLCPEDMLIALCIHAAKDGWMRLAWVIDIAQLATASPALDWHALMDRAAGLRARRIVCLGLYLARDLLGLALPPQALTHLDAERNLEPLAQEVIGVLFSKDFDPDNLSTLSDRFRAASREHLRDKLRHGLHFIAQRIPPTEADSAFIRLPRWLSPLYYLIRPVRLTLRLLDRDSRRKG